MALVDQIKVNEWIEKIEICSVVDTFAEDDNLRAFLDETQVVLAKLETTASITEQLPNVGQFLTKLGRKPEILLQGGIYSSFLRCVLALIPSDPKTQLEQKASYWGQALIRKTSNYFNQLSPNNRVGKVIGYGISHYHQCAIEQLTRSICRKLDLLSTRPRDSQSASIVQHISLQMVPLAQFPSCHPIVEKLLWYSKTTNQPVLSEEFLEQLINIHTKHFSESETDLLGHSICLCKNTIVALWSSYMPALERSVMAFVAMLCNRPHIGHREAAKLLTASHLPQACQKDSTFYFAVEQVLRKLLYDTEGSGLVLKAINIFYTCYLQQGSMDPSASLLIHPELASLDTLLTVHPSDLDSSSRFSHLKHLCKFANHDQMATVSTAFKLDTWFMFAKHQHWYHQCLLCAFCEDASISQPCCRLIEWFHSPMSVSENSNIADSCVQCIHKNLPPTRMGPVELSIYYQLLISYTVLTFNNGLKDLNKVTRLLSKDASTFDELVFTLDLLDTFDFALNDRGRVTLLTFLKELKASRKDVTDNNDITVRMNFHLKDSQN